ncbi:MAG: hypothetical protein P8100_10740 [bacterium]
MPGFTLIYQYGGLDEGIRRRIEKLEKASFRVQMISNTQSMVLLFREGNHYPYQILKRKEYILIIEGMLLGIDPAKDDSFVSHCDAAFKGIDLEQNKEYFHGIDGEFILYMLSRKGDHFVMLNDYLGRLPQYFMHSRQFIISRDLFIMDKITTGLLFDETSIYQFMRLGFPLGERTLFHEIDRIPHGAHISAEKDKIRVNRSSLDLESMEGSNTDKDALHILISSFRKAVEDRMTAPGRKVVSLSGGLDSRVIMGEIEKSGSTSDYITFSYDNPIILRDVAMAKKIGRAFNRSPQVSELQEWTPESFDELTYAKSGLNYLGMAFLVGFLAKAGHAYDIMITGDGGDKTLPYMFPIVRVKMNQFSNYLLRQHAVASRKTLDSFLTTDVKRQEKIIKEFLEELPGKNPRFKYKHFLFFERARHWLFEGEDRNRSYLWSTTPFYSPQFFRLAHTLPEKEKLNFRLFRQFMTEIDEELGNIPNANWGFALNDTRRVEKMISRQRWKQKLHFLGRSRGGQASFHEQMATLVASLMHKGYGGQIAVYADRHDLNAASSETLFHLITLLKVSEMSWRSV